MDTHWIIFLLLGINTFAQPTNCQSNVEAQLILKKYVEKGSSVTMLCKHNVPPKILYKITWRKVNEGKIFEYIKGRNPPYRNFSVPGAELDWSGSSPEQVVLKKLDFDASGSYYCEVSTDTPIFTKPSADEPLHVILPQVGPPRISFSKRHFYVGEKLIANCTTSKARPAPHITWLINGKKWSGSSPEQVVLKKLDFDASGSYYCEVSTDTPIFTKPSADEPLHVILPQVGPPRISFSKRHFYVGEKLIANCTTSKARPAPHITWLINGKKVDEKYVRALHPYATGNKSGHRSKAHQQQQQLGKPNIGKGLRNSGGNRDMVVYGNGYDIGYDHSGGLSIGGSNIAFGNSPYDIFEIPVSQQTSSDYFDNTFFETRKYRNFHNRKHRRYVDDATGNTGGSNTNIGGPSGSGSGVVSRAHRAVVSSSQLSIEVSDLHASVNGKLEITCLATIPAHVGSDEQFADYKTYSVKIDVEAVESTSIMPSMSGMAALGNASSARKQHHLMPSLLYICGINVFILIQLMKYDFRN